MSGIDRVSLRARSLADRLDSYAGNLDFHLAYASSVSFNREQLDRLIELLREAAAALVPPASPTATEEENDQLSQRYSRTGGPVQPEASSVQPANATAWLIESASPQGCPQYWDGRKDNSFTIDANEAVRFATFESAERVRAWMLLEAIRWHCRSVQHMWMAPPEVHPASLTATGEDHKTIDGSHGSPGPSNSLEGAPRRGNEL